MTDSTAPERIWATWKEDFGAVQIGTWADTVRFEPLGAEYVRADIYAALLAERDAAVAQNDRLWAANKNLVAEQDKAEDERDALAAQLAMARVAGDDVVRAGNTLMLMLAGDLSMSKTSLEAALRRSLDARNAWDNALKGATP